MKGKKIMRLLGFLAFCLICLWAVGENAWAAEKKVPYDTALRVHFKNWGCHLGKSNHCYYTNASNIYGDRKNGVVIVGFQETVKEIRIPEKIKGKKVIAIHLISFETLSSSYEDYKREDHILITSSFKTKSIVVPRYVSEISAGAYFFDRVGLLENLEKFKVSSKNKHFKSISGVLFTKSGKKLLIYPDRRKASKYRIPNGVTEVSDNSFRDAGVRQVVIPDTVKIVAPYAFGYSKLERVSLSKKLKRIGIGAFEGCRLKKITLPKKLKFIEDSAFKNTELREITIPGKVKEVPDFCFDSCKKLERVTIKKGVKKIKERAFVYCYHLKKVVIPSSVKTIEDNPFAIDRLWFSEKYNNIDYEKEDQMAWRSAGVVLYVKRGSYADQKLKKVSWVEELGMRVYYS